jgi:acyl-homoserine lactone acylase PvdQ
MSKPQSREVPSDGCEVAYDGVTYCPHEGESVWVWPDSSIELFRLGLEIQAMKGRIDAIADDPDATQQALRIVTEAFDPLAARLASRIDRWTWTDLHGNPKPSPSPAVLAALETEELIWLCGAVRGETPESRKNGSPGSPTTSSATRSRRSPAPSSTAPSPSRAS